MSKKRRWRRGSRKIAGFSPYKITSTHAGICCGCGKKFSKGDPILWARTESGRSITAHQDCPGVRQQFKDAARASCLEVSSKKPKHGSLGERKLLKKQAVALEARARYEKARVARLKRYGYGPDGIIVSSAVVEMPVKSAYVPPPVLDSSDL